MKIQHFFELMNYSSFNNSVIQTISHLYASLWNAKLFDISPAVIFLNFFLYPLEPLVSQTNKFSQTNFSLPFNTLYTAIKSPHPLLCPIVVRPSTRGDQKVMTVGLVPERL